MLGKLFIILNTVLIAHPYFNVYFKASTLLILKRIHHYSDRIVYKAGKASTRFLIRN